MNRNWIVALLLVGVLASPVTLYAQATDAESVLKAVSEALNVKDVDKAIALVADDAVLTLAPAPPGGTGVYRGKEQIHARFKEVVAANTDHKFGRCQTQGDKVTCSATVLDDAMRSMGLSALDFTVEATAQGGKLKSVTWTLSPDALAKLQAAMAPKTMPETGAAFPLYSLAAWLGAGVLLAGLGLGLLRRHVR